MLKKALIKKFFKSDLYDKIVRRINYYDFISISKNVDFSLPRESCLEKMYRKLIKREPPPYYSDYREVGTDVTELHDYLIYTTRMKFGYSRRITTPTTSIIGSDETSHENLRNSNNRSKTNLKVSIHNPRTIKLTTQKSSSRSNQVLPSPNTSDN